MTTPQRWPDRDQIITDLLATAESYAQDEQWAAHPEDIATALINAIEVAWRMVKPE